MAVDANVRDSKITHSLNPALRTKHAHVEQIKARIRPRPSDETGRRSSAFVHKDSETAEAPLRRNGGLVVLLGEGAGDAGSANAELGGGVRKQSGSLGTRPSSPMGHVGNRRSARESAP